MVTAQLTAPAHPIDFDLQGWRRHANRLLQTWLAEDFTWGGAPLSTFISAVTAALGDGTTFPLWGDHRLLATPTPAAVLDASLEDAEHDPWHPAWIDLISAPWELKGRWLHPDTAYEIDQMVFARNGGNLLIACADRSQPGTEPHLDPTQSPYFTDQGVIAAPMLPFRALRHLENGHNPAEALLLLAGTAVAEFCVHEALETFQAAPGSPDWDPHDSPYSLDITLYWRTPVTVCQAWPIKTY
ncbi:hypothetical protein ABT340_39480 [Streptosporangium sp. NPDC000239]|uniref:hypothetical protein n=1 Tax=Streptosporangium sp. NPDC000239 TaxID=3154248 RepID=UPI0033229407